MTFPAIDSVMGSDYKSLILCDISANRPTTPSCLPGSAVFYYASDTGVLSVYQVARPAVGSAAAAGAWVTLTSGVSPASTAHRLLIKNTGINFDATSGTDILILTPALPAGFTRFMVANMFITNASHTLATVSVGMWSAASAGGTAIIAAYTPGNTSATDGTAHNASIALAAATFGQTTCFASGDSVYVNLVTQEGAATTADVSVEYIPLP